MAPVPQPPDLPDDLPPHVVAYLRALEATIAPLTAQVRGLTAQVADLTARLNQNASNSSKPPSSDAPHVKTAPPKPPSGTRRGGQPGHPKAERTLLPPEAIRPLRPDRCRGCARPLTGDDPEPAVHQVHEIAVVKPHVAEYRCHRVRCPHGGTTTVAPVPPEATTGYGPRAQAVAALLTGACRRGQRGTSQLFGDRFGLPVSPAMVCKLQHRTAEALGPVAEEALGYTRGHPANVDETGWKEGRTRAWLWVAATTLVVAFVIRRPRGRSAFEDLRTGSSQVHTTDRYPVYTHLKAHQRQVCWAHLDRDFQAVIDRANGGSGVGADLLGCSDALFEHWYRVRDGTLSRTTFRSLHVRGLRARVPAHLERGARCGCPKAAGTCRDRLAIEASLWTFARVPGVEPTNNAAEREVRHAVCGGRPASGPTPNAGPGSWNAS